jgi:hypothetical protein
MPAKLQPALLGGLLIGVLSALPFVSVVNGCCCLWVIAGGVLTSYLLQERSATAIDAGGAAVSGLQAGMVGAIVAAVLGAAVTFLTGGGAEQLDQMPRGDLPPQIVEMFDRFRELPAAVWYVGPFLAYIIIFPIFSTLGALLGVALFKKNPPPPPPGTVEILPPE